MEIYVTDWSISDRLKKLLTNNNLLTLSSIENCTKEFILNIDGFGKTALEELEKYLYFNYKTKLTKKKKVKIDNYNDCKEIIEYFLGTKGFSWPKEIIAAKRLLDRYKKSTILSVPVPSNIKSLSWLLGDWGTEYISKNRTDLILAKIEKPEKIQLTEQVADNYIPILDHYKPKRIKDFLRQNGVQNIKRC